jgi:TolA-binding protein
MSYVKAFSKFIKEDQVVKMGANPSTQDVELTDQQLIKFNDQIRAYEKQISQINLQIEQTKQQKAAYLKTLQAKAQVPAQTGTTQTPTAQ